MSLNRPKRASSRSTKEVDTGYEAVADLRNMRWQSAIDGRNPKDFRLYSVGHSYAAGEGLYHPKFGNGVVVEVESTKITVLFELGERKLAHGIE